MSDLKMRKDESVDAWLERLPPEQSAILKDLRALIRQAAPHLKERVKWSQPWYEGSDNVFYLSCQKNYATFGVCRGAHLPNPDGLLEGTGKHMRHVKVRSRSDAAAPALRRLVQEAVDHDSAL